MKGNRIASYPAHSLTTLNGFNTFLLKIFREQIGYKKDVMGASVPENSVFNLH